MSKCVRIFIPHLFLSAARSKCIINTKFTLDVLGLLATFKCSEHFVYMQTASGDGGQPIEFGIQKIGRERTRVGGEKVRSKNSSRKPHSVAL